MGRDLSVDRKRNLTLVVTHQCNFDCRYCLQKHEDVYMPRETAVKAIDMLVDGLSKIKENPRAQISFYGGEPLLARNEIEYLVTYAREKFSKIKDLKYGFEITTNGLLLDQEFIDFAKKNRILLALSYDGVAQDEVRIKRGGNPTREIVDKKLDMLLKTFPETIIMMTIHPDYASTISESVKYFHAKGVRAVSLVPAHGNRVTWNDDSFAILSSELEKVKNLYIRWNEGDNYFRFIPFENKIRNYIREKDADNAMCHFGCHKLMVDADGKYYPCNHFIGMDGYSIGSVTEGTDEKKIASLESKRVEATDCEGCVLRPRCRHTCACANHGHTGDMSQVSALQCEYEQLTIRLADEAAAVLLAGENPTFIRRMYKE